MNADALLDAEQRAALAHRAVDDRDDDLVVQAGGAADHVEVPVGDRVIGAGAHGDDFSGRFMDGGGL